jgi:hypothetical protein
VGITISFEALLSYNAQSKLQRRNLHLATYARERKARLIKVYYAPKEVQLTKKLLPVPSASTSKEVFYAY